MRRGSIRSQSGFKHGYQARRNLPKYMWSLVKEVSGKLRKRPFFWSTKDGGHSECYREFSRDVTAAMLMSPNKGTAAILVSFPTNSSGIWTLFSCKHFLSFVLVEKHVHSSREWKHSMRSTPFCNHVITHVTITFRHIVFEEGWGSTLFCVFPYLLLHYTWNDHGLI